MDDDPSIARLVALQLAAEDVQTVEWTDHFDAITTRIDWNAVDAVVVDKLLGMYDGTQLLRWLKSEYPHVRRVMLTADAAVNVETSPAHMVLVKPHLPEALRTAIYGE